MLRRAYSSLTSSVAAISDNLTVKATISTKFKILPQNARLVQRLFKPFIPADFEPSLDPKTGKKMPPLVSQEELKELREQAYLFGLDPTRDLKLPEPKERPQIEVSDKRLFARLARFEAKRKQIEERQQERLDRQRRKLLAKGKITWDEIEREDQDRLDDQELMTGPQLPWHLLPRAERQKVEKERLQTVSKLMSSMDERLTEMKQRRRERRKKKLEGGLPF